MPTFIELSNTFGFTVAILLVGGFAAYKGIIAMVNHLNEEKGASETKYEKLVTNVQAENKLREEELRKTLKENEVKTEGRDKEYRAIIQKLSENFDVLKEIKVKFENFEVKFEDLEIEIKQTK